MNAETYHEVVETGLEFTTMPKSLIENALNKKIEEGKVLIMTNEEERMIRSFRAFRANMRRSGEVFKWQTTKDERAIVPGDEAPMILEPETTEEYSEYIGSQSA